jgi:hypothetical protein
MLYLATIKSISLAFHGSFESFHAVALQLDHYFGILIFIHALAHPLDSTKIAKLKICS